MNTNATYDRELIARMLEAARRGGMHQFSVETWEGQIAALRAAGMQTANATDPVRALIADWRESAAGAKRYSTTDYEDGYAAAERNCANRLEAALAQQPEADTTGWSLLDRVEFALRDAGFDYDEAFRIAHLASQPEAPAQEAVFLVATGDSCDRLPTYTRHTECPPNCDAERLYTAPQPAIPEGWPKASGRAAESGWTLDYGFLCRVQKRVEEEGSASLELVETIMRAGLEVHRLHFAAQPSREGE